MRILAELLQARLVRLLGLLLAVSLLILTFVTQWPAVSARIPQFSPPAVLGSGAAVLSGLFASVLAWRAVLAGLGHTLPIPGAMHAFFVAQLGKYVPGSVWPFLAQLHVAKRYGVPLAPTGIAAITVMVLNTATGATIGLALLIGHSTYLPLAIIVAALGLVLLHPAVFTELVRLAYRVLRPDAEPPAMSSRSLITATVWTLAMWAFFGLHVLTLGWTFGLNGLADLLLAAGAYAAAWTVGFIVVFTPAGAGVRETVLIALLAPTIGVGPAGALALISRLLMTAADGIWAAIALISNRRVPGQQASVGSGHTLT